MYENISLYFQHTVGLVVWMEFVQDQTTVFVTRDGGGLTAALVNLIMSHGNAFERCLMSPLSVFLSAPPPSLCIPLSVRPLSLFFSLSLYVWVCLSMLGWNSDNIRSANELTVFHSGHVYLTDPSHFPLPMISQILVRQKTLISRAFIHC